MRRSSLPALHTRVVSGIRRANVLQNSGCAGAGRRRRTPRARAGPVASGGSRRASRAAPTPQGLSLEARPAARQSRRGRPGTTPRRPRSPPARSSRWRRRGGRRAGPFRRRRRAALAGRRRAPGRSACGPAPADFRVAADRAQPRARGVEQDEVEGGAEGQRRGIEPDDVHRPGAAAERPCPGAGPRRRPLTSPAMTAPWSCMAAAIATVFPPGDAQASSTRSPGRAAAASATSCDASSCTKNSPCSNRGAASGCPLTTTSPVGGEAGGLDGDAVRRERRHQASRVVFNVFARRVTGAGLLSKCAHASAASKPRRATSALPASGDATA